MGKRKIGQNVLLWLEWFRKKIAVFYSNILNLVKKNVGKTLPKPTTTL